MKFLFTIERMFDIMSKLQNFEKNRRNQEMRDQYEEAREKLRSASAIADAFWATVIENCELSEYGTALFNALLCSLKDAGAKMDELEKKIGDMEDLLK